MVISRPMSLELPELPEVPTRTFAAGAVIFREGDASQREAYLVQSGTVEICKSTGVGEPTRRTLVAGDVLGEVALFRDGAHSATAVAVEDVTLLVISESRLERMVRASPDLAMALIRQLAQMAAGREDDVGAR